MSVEITRDRVNEVMRRHGDIWPDDTEFGPVEVRQYAKYLRFGAEFPGADYNDNMIQAAELDLLVDRAEATA